jgi:cysteine-rich repeat protein
MASVRLGVVVMVGAFSGCLPPASEPCDDGILCPSDKVCLPAGGGCATGANVDACAGLSDGDPCEGDFGTGGACRAGACAVVVCGDGLRELAEACDDGGVLDGDGCSARCDSDETCGNGVIDLAPGEACDLGPGLSRDGCSSSCEVELPSWRALADATLARDGAAIAYDSDRGRIVLFGGAVLGVPTSDTWEFDGLAWRLVDVQGTPPPPRVFHAMAYDPTRQEVVMFGGASELPPGDDGYVDLVGDMWTYRDRTWTHHVDHVGPSVASRMKHAMVFDPALDTVVLVGGQAGDGTAVEGTLQRVGEEFVPLELMGQPPPCEATSAAYHPGREGIILLCGHPSGNPEVFRLGPSGWELMTETPPGSKTTEAAMVYDPDQDALVLLGTYDNGAAGYVTAAWTLGAAGDWTLAPAFDVPSGRQVRSAIYDPIGARIVVPRMLGALAVAETWSHTPAGGWRILLDTRPLPPMTGVQLAEQPARGPLLLVGASAGQWAVETWESTGGVWARRFPDVVPPDRNLGALAFDSARQQVLLFGGSTQDFGWRNDLWSWDGTTWALRHDGAAPAPSPRAMANLVYDAARDQLVLFGGVDGDFAQPVTWTFDLEAGTWTEHDVAGPSRRQPSAMAYDPRAEQVVLVGGWHAVEEEETLEDVWAWDGVGWTELGRAGGPPPGTAKAMAWEPTLGALVLVAGGEPAGVDLAAYVRRGDAWEAAPSELAPPAADRHALAYDAWSRRLVSHGSDDATWAFAFINGAYPPEVCAGDELDSDGDGLAGCADPDCWARCTPTCPPDASCSDDAPRCGDGACAPGLEDAALCPADCG